MSFAGVTVYRQFSIFCDIYCAGPSISEKPRVSNAFLAYVDTGVMIHAMATKLYKTCLDLSVVKAFDVILFLNANPDAKAKST